MEESSPDSTPLYILFFPIWTARTVQQTPQPALARCCSIIAPPITAFDVSLRPQRALRISTENSVFARWSQFDVVSFSSPSRRPSPRRLAVRSSFTQLARGEAWKGSVGSVYPSHAAQRCRLPPHKLETGSRHTSNRAIVSV